MLSIVCLHYQNDNMTVGCLHCIDSQKMPVAYEKVVVDNGSSPAFQPWENWRIHRVRENLGVIGGVNEAFRAARYPWVLFVSNDVRLQAYCIERLWYFKYEGARVMPVVYQPNGKVDCSGMDYVWPGYGIGRRRFAPGPTKVVPNIAFLCRKKVWERVGGFDERLVMGYEDVDFDLRAGPGFVVASARAVHMGNATLKKTLTNHRAVYRRARWRVIRQNFGGIERLLRLAAVKVLDGARSLLP